MENREEKLNQLKTYFEKRDDVRMAFVFGSQSTQRTHSGSDWDVAVYLKPRENPIEWEAEEQEYPGETELKGDCIDILGTDSVDFVVLNRAAATVAEAALRGVPLIIKDGGVWLEFMLRVTQAAEDFRQTAKEYAEIYWRSRSLDEQSAYALDRRLVFLDGELRTLKNYTHLTWTTYQQNDQERRAAERTIENIINAAIDIAKIILASQKRAVPATYKEILRTLGTVTHFTPQVAEQLSRWAGLRNILAHEYLDLRWKPIEDFLKNGEGALTQFLTSARAFLATQQPA